MKKRFALFAAIALILAIAAGCATQDASTPDNIVKAGGTSVTVTVASSPFGSRPAIYVGQEAAETTLSFRGYCFAVEADRVVLYRAEKELTELASRAFAGIKRNAQQRLRVEIEDTVIRCFVLDDADGITPWPEIELSIRSCQGYKLGCLDLEGKQTVFTDWQVRYYTPAVHEKTYTNPIYNGPADPEVIYEDGLFYLYGTMGLGYRVHTSTDFVNWKPGGTVAHNNLWNIAVNYWAPDIEYMDGKYYMAASCDKKLGFAVSDSLRGPFKAVGDAPLFNDAIDGHIFVDDDGSRYLYYVGMESVYGIYGVELDENMQPIVSTTTLLIQPTDPWEKTRGSVTEGPYMLKHNGLYYLTYSGSGYEDIYYAVGYAVAESPLGQYEKYQQNPILVGNSQIHGVGHHCVVTIPESGEMWMIYHCHNSLSVVHERKVCIDRMRFAPVEGDIDRLEVYGPTVTAQPYPEIG